MSAHHLVTINSDQPIVSQPEASWASDKQWFLDHPNLTSLLRQHRNELCLRTLNLAQLINVLYSDHKIGQAYTGDFGNAKSYDISAWLYDQLAIRDIDKVTLFKAWDKSSNGHLVTYMHKEELDRPSNDAVDSNIGQSASQNLANDVTDLEAGELNKLTEEGAQKFPNPKISYFDMTRNKIKYMALITIIAILMVVLLCVVLVPKIRESKSDQKPEGVATEKSLENNSVDFDLEKTAAPIKDLDVTTSPLIIPRNESLLIRSVAKLVNLTPNQVITDTLIVDLKLLEVVTFAPPPLNSLGHVIDHVTTLNITGSLSRLLMDYLLQKFPQVDFILISMTVICTSPPSLWKNSVAMGTLNFDNIEKFRVVKSMSCHAASIIWRWRMPNLKMLIVQDSNLTTSQSFRPVHKFMIGHNDTVQNVTFCRSPICGRCGYLDIPFEHRVDFRHLQYC